MSVKESTKRSFREPYKLPQGWRWEEWGSLMIDFQQGLIRSNNQLGAGNVDYLKMGDLDSSGGYSNSKLARTEATEEEIASYTLSKGDFLLNVRNSMELVGKTCVVGETGERPLLFNHMLVRVQHRHDIPNNFINAFLSTEIGRKFVARCKQGTTTIIALYKRDLVQIPVPIPNTQTVNFISSFWECIQRKIELNNQINNELDAMAKLLYDYWFVQFDFPMTAAQAASLGRPALEGKPYKSSGGKMVHNPTLNRKIPEGWTTDTLQHFIANDKTGDWGQDESTGNYTERVTCIRGTDLNALNGAGLMNPPTRFILKKNLTKLLIPNDVIIEISGGSPTQSTGRAGLITKHTLERFKDPLICSNFCKAISIRKETWLHYFMQSWKRLYDNGVLFGWEGKTSGIKNLLFDSFIQHHKVAIPPDYLLKQFHDVMDPQHAQTQKLLIQNQELTQLRDWLLPMLMNGQVTVS